jgi:hypothetical protein
VNAASHIVLWAARVFFVIAVVLLILHVQRYPQLSHFIAYDRRGRRRSNILMPVAALLAVSYVAKLVFRLIHALIGG